MVSTKTIQLPGTDTLSALDRHLFGDSSVTPGARRALLSLCSTKHFDSGSWLLRAGERAEWSFLITSGLVRELYIGLEGEEHTRSFLAEGELTGSLLDLLSGEPSITWIQALEPTETLMFRYRDFSALCDQHPDLQKIAKRAAQTLAVRKTRREHEMLAMTATERYRRWLRENPELDARVSRKQLASYLGVTPEHVSRMRRSR